MTEYLQKKRREGTDGVKMLGKRTGFRDRQGRMHRGKDGVVNNGRSVLRP